MSRHIGLLGGSFNPIHLGHLAVARSVAEKLALDRVILLPSASPPHKAAGSLASTHHRVEMVRLAVEDDQLLHLSDYDATRPGPSYTIDTVTHLQERLGREVKLYWIIGADWMEELAGWRRIGALVEACTIVTAARPGWSGFPREALRTVLSEGQVSAIEANVLDTTLVDISATDIRSRIISNETISDLVPGKVAEYIKQHGLYR